ncbi:thermonuclease family protein [Aestuariivivens sediminis]|uniref:thermonuclease family protein n=1 Tax=Aestuariivivens sediminis TaxID=2913557 RepID=UPI001F587875|nr:thermonuclease family protein [Aestuariivivens sediminis]
MNRAILLIAFIFSLTSYSQEVIIGKVISITDGDTFKILNQDSTQLKIRVANIDCPERKQPFSQRAKEFTSNAVFNKNVQLNVLNEDRYGRYVALVKYNDSLDLSQELIKNGLAWHYKKYSKDSLLQHMENRARNQKIGLWNNPHPIAPWEWRSSKKNKIKK